MYLHGGIRGAVGPKIFQFTARTAGLHANPTTLGLPASPEQLTELVQRAPGLLLLQADLPHCSVLARPLGLR